MVARCNGVPLVEKLEVLAASAVKKYLEELVTGLTLCADSVRIHDGEPII